MLWGDSILMLTVILDRNDYDNDPRGLESQISRFFESLQLDALK
jgi:hypothetical protein